MAIGTRIEVGGEDTARRGLEQVLQVLAACRVALNALVAEVIEGHIGFHVAYPDDRPGTRPADAVEELIDVLRTYMR